MRTIHFRRAAAAMLAALMLPSASSLAVSAENGEKKIVILGDGVSSGRSLEDPSRSYAKLAADYIGGTVTDYSADQCMTGDLLVTLDDPTVQETLSQADVIIFSVGVQDLMQPFIDQLVEYQEKLGFNSLDALYKMSRAEIGLTDDQLSSYSVKLKRALESNEESCAENLLAIGQKLSAYPNAQVICPNVYNCLNTIEGYDTMSDSRQQAYRTVLNPSKWVTETANNAYAQLASDYGFTVIDACGMLGDKAYKYTNQVELDYELKQNAHCWIAQEIARVYDGGTLGDPNSDTLVNAIDANLILEHAAVFGSDQTGTLSKGLQLLSDVNRDGRADAADAADILVYAAEKGAGGSPVLGG